VEVHLIAVNQIPMKGLKEVLVMTLQAKKEVSNQEVPHILADLHLTIDLKEALTVILQVKRKALSQEVPHTQVDQHLMTDLKEALVVNLQVRRKVLNQEARHTLAGQLLTTDLKEVLAMKIQAIRSSTDARQKVRDLKSALMILPTSHSANQKIHPTISLKLSVTRMQNRCVAEKNQAQKMMLA
jgi:hypothetical protein